MRFDLIMIRLCGGKYVEGHQILAVCSFVLVVIIAGEWVMALIELDREWFFTVVTTLLFMQIFSMTTASARLNELFWRFYGTSSSQKKWSVCWI